jgi:hypothetical protein
MVRFKIFMAVWVSVIVAVSVFAVGITWKLENRDSGTSSNHFSVRWMGFRPAYSDKYPDYYVCINDLKRDTLVMNIALQIKNQEDRGYYFKVDKYQEPPEGWTVSPLEVGYIGKDETKNFVYNISRSKPDSIVNGRLTERINLVVQAFYDLDYSNLYSQDNFTVTFHLIDLASSVWSLLYYDSFDDGTTQGWSRIGGGDGSLIVSDTYYRSFPYSLRLLPFNSWYNYYDAGYVKSFDVGAAQEAYLIFSIRSDNWPTTPRILLDGVQYFSPDVQPSTNTWYRIVIPLPTDKKTEVQIWSVAGKFYSYLDDVYVIAK